MKKLIALCVAMLLCVSLVSVTALAAATPSLKVSSAAGVRGEEVTVTVKLENNPGIAGMDITVSYDKNSLEKVSFVGTNALGGTWTIDNHAIWDNAGNSTNNGDILKLTFKVKENAKCGAANVTVNCTAGNWNLKPVTMSVTAGSVTIGHKWGQWKETPASCTEPGVKERVCQIQGCGEKETLPLEAGHKWGTPKVTPPTCTEAGKIEYTCSACGQKRTETGDPATGHKWGTPKVTPPTCTEAGKLDYTCSGCGLKKSETGDPATGHKWGDPKVTPATCTEAGKKDYTCSGCGLTKSEPGDPATGHKVETGEWRHDKDQHWHECKGGCGEKFDCADHKMETKQNKLGQSYSKCSVCGYETVPVGEIPDDVPPTGDITIFYYGGALILLALACATAFVVKRKAVR